MADQAVAQIENGNIYTWPTISATHKFMPQVVLAAIKKDYNVWKSLPTMLTNNAEFARKVVNVAPRAFEFMSQVHRENSRIALIATSRDETMIPHIGTLMQSHQFITHLMELNGMALAFVESRWKRTYSIVETAVRQNGLALQFADREFREDEDIVIIAILNNPSAVQYSLADACFDCEIADAALGRHPSSFEYFPTRMKENSSVVMLMVQMNGNLIRLVNANVITFEIALAAVKNKGNAYSYLAAPWTDNREIQLAAVGQAGFVLRYMPADLQDDREIVMAAVANDELNTQDEIFQSMMPRNETVKYISERLRADPEIALAAVRCYGESINSFSQEIQDTHEIALMAVSQTGWAIKYLSQELRDDYDIAFAAVSATNSFQFRNMPREIMQRSELVDKIHNGVTCVFASMSERLRAMPIMAITALETHPGCQKSIREFIWDCLPVMTEIIKKYGGHLLELATNDLQDNRKLARLAGDMGWLYVSPRLRSLGTAYINRPDDIMEAISECNFQVNRIPLELHAEITSYLE